MTLYVPLSKPDNGQASYKPGMLPVHLEDLRNSGLSDAQIEACRFYSVVKADDVAKILNWDKPAKRIGPCLAIPYFDADGKQLDYVRLKPSNPRVNKEDGKPVKYESPKGMSNRAYFPPGMRAALKDPTAPLLVTEGEKKAAKADQEGFLCIGFVGVHGFQKKRAKNKDGKATGPRELIPDLAAIPWQGRLVFIVYDSDLADNVRWAEYQLAEVLTAAAPRSALSVFRLAPPDRMANRRRWAWTTSLLLTARMHFGN